jgi:hypothetical protein
VIHTAPSRSVLQLELFSEQICEVEDHGVRYVPRRNEETAARQKHLMEDKLARLESKIAERNQWAGQHPRSKLETGLRQLEAWAQRHKLDELVELQQEGDRLQMKPKPEAIDRSLELAGCYVLTSDVTPAKLEAAQVHESYMALEKVERDFRAMKTGLLGDRDIVRHLLPHWERQPIRNQTLARGFTPFSCRKMRRTWRHALRRRSQRTKMNWERFNRTVNHYVPRVRVLHPYPDGRFKASHPTFGRSPMR